MIYADTVAHISGSEVEVTGLVFERGISPPPHLRDGAVHAAELAGSDRCHAHRDARLLSPSTPASYWSRSSPKTPRRCRGIYLRERDLARVAGTTRETGTLAGREDDGDCRRGRTLPTDDEAKVSSSSTFSLKYSNQNKTKRWYAGKTDTAVRIDEILCGLGIRTDTYGATE